MININAHSSRGVRDGQTEFADNVKCRGPASMEGTPGPSHTEEQSTLIARFVAVTDCPEAEAQFYLDATGSDFDRAVSLYYGTWDPAHIQFCKAWSTV